MDLDLKRLEQILAVARTGSISKAAQELHLTQPALSRSIATLEERYGFRVFERSRGGATLTAIGKSLVSEAERLLREARSVDHNFRLYKSGEAGQLAIGMGPLLASMLLPALSIHFLRERPHLRIQAITRPAGVLYQELLDDHIELLFCGHEQLSDQPGISIERVGEIALSYIVRSGHPLTRQTRLRREDLAPYPLLIGAEPHSPVFSGSQSMFICDNYHILRETTLNSDAVWLSSPDFVRREIDTAQLLSLPLVDQQIQSTSPVYRVSRQANRLSPGAQAVQDFIEGLLQAR